jgi:hypothetical protein
MLSLHLLQSTSDQEDAVLYAYIGAPVPTAVMPEQSASWAYPHPGWDGEKNAPTAVNVLLGRVHLSGRVDALGRGQRELVGEGMRVYRAVLAFGGSGFGIGVDGVGDVMWWCGGVCFCVAVWRGVGYVLSAGEGVGGQRRC